MPLVLTVQLCPEFLATRQELIFPCDLGLIGKTTWVNNTPQFRCSGATCVPEPCLYFTKFLAFSIRM